MKQHIATSNFATYKPGKDRCDTCTAYNAGNVDENEYQEHIKKKKRSHGRKEKRELISRKERMILQKRMMQ